MALLEERPQYYFDEHRRFHREDGPAIIYTNGDKQWYHHGQLHCLSGPAVDWVNGYKEWWIYGEHINCHSQQQFEQLLKLKAFW